MKNSIASYKKTRNKFNVIFIKVSYCIFTLIAFVLSFYCHV